MPAKKPQKFGIGAYWPDDFSDYLVHFEDPFCVFRIEADREGPILFWAPPSEGLSGLDDQAFSRLLAAAEAFLAREGIGGPGGGDRHAEYRESHVPFPPCLVVSNRSSAFSAVVGLGERPFAAYFNPDETGSLFVDFDVWMTGATESQIEEMGRFAEAYYGEFYDRQIFLDEQEKKKGDQGNRGDLEMYARN